MAVQSEDVIRLWPEGPPTQLEGVGPEIEFRGSLGTAGDAVMLRNVSEPTLTVFRPTNGKPNGTGVIVCPGGGWRILSWEHEGIDVAKWLTAHGYTAFLLKYRVHGTPAAQADYDAWEVQLTSQIDLTRRGRTAFRAVMGEIESYETFRAAREVAADDGRRAVAIVRERAKEWEIDSRKIGMIGFSAGAFLVVDVAVDPRAAPLAFVAPIYGGETLGRAVPADAPPLFVVMAQDDFLCRLAEGLYGGWTDAERSAEVHIYRRGNHGFGLMKQGLPSDRWINLFHEWLADQGLADVKINHT
jgi:acetyl esterase/lipase